MTGGEFVTEVDRDSDVGTINPREDPQGILVVLIAWATEPPPGLPRPAVLARAAQIRDAAGDTYVEDRHVQQAIADLTAGA